MEMRNIKTFIRVAELGNFSRAAQDLGYAQSTVTTQIQMLEKELQVTLFERNGKHVSLSGAGKEFLEYAYQMQRYEAMAINHFASGQEPHGSVTIGVMETICASHYGEIFRIFTETVSQGGSESSCGNDAGMHGNVGKRHAGCHTHSR